MICPKCHNEVSDTALRCPICNTKLKMFCPSCHSLINFGVKICNVCGSEVLKKCKNCGAINLADENICRKCKKPINVKIAEDNSNKANSQNVNPAPSNVQKFKTAPTNLEKPVVSKDIKKEEPKKQIEQQEDEKNIETNETDNKQAQINTAEIFEFNISNENETHVQSQTEKTDDIQLKYYEQPEAKDRLYTALKDDFKQIVSLSGNDGYGKSAIIKTVIPMLNKDSVGVLYSECTPNTQLSAYGAIQCAFRKYLALPDFYANSDIFERTFKPVISKAFPYLSREEFACFCNFLYPKEVSYFENIIVNQQNLYTILDKIILQISAIYPLVIIVDSFELIDAASYKYLMSLIKREIINNKIKLCVSYKEHIKVQSYLHYVSENENIYENIYLTKLSKKNFDDLVKSFLNGYNPLPEGITKQILKAEDGNAGYCEQAIFYLNDLNAFIVNDGNVEYSTEAYDIQLPDTYEKLVAQRVQNLKTNSEAYYEFLINSSILGPLFNAQIVQTVLNLDDDATNDVLNLLINSGYILPYQNTDFVFRNINFWKHVYDIAKKDEKFVEYNKSMHNLLSAMEYYNLPIKALFAQNIEENYIAFNLWTQNIQVASAVGDIDLYILSQKQCLKLLQEFAHTDSDYIANNIHERIGKLIYKSNPMEATEFLTNAMANYHQNGNIIKLIELSGFLLKAQKMEDNALSIIEIVDNVLRNLPEKGYELEIALIKAKKVEAILKIGNYDELTNLVRNDIIPVLEAHLAKSVPHKRYSHEFIFDVWVQVAICEANAYSYQGNDKSLEVISVIEDVLKANNQLDVSLYKDVVEVAKAAAYTIKGQLEFSDAILNSIDVQNNNLSMRDVSFANLIRIVNKILRFDFVNIREDLFDATTFANNCNDVVLKNVFKTLLAKLIKEDGNAQKALDIYNEQITYFAGEKISVGAFLCWFLMSELFLITDGPDKALEIATKSLEIAKNPKIVNYNFMILFKKLIAEIYIIKKDYDAAKMYIEKALLLARKFGLDYFVMLLYSVYGKYFEEIITSKTSNSPEYVKNALKMYDKSIDLAKELNIEKYITSNENAKQSLMVYCQLNNLNID